LATSNINNELKSRLAIFKNAARNKNNIQIWPAIQKSACPCNRAGVARLFCLRAKFHKDIVLRAAKFFWALSMT